MLPPLWKNNKRRGSTRIAFWQIRQGEVHSCTFSFDPGIFPTIHILDRPHPRGIGLYSAFGINGLLHKTVRAPLLSSSLFLLTVVPSPLHPSPVTTKGTTQAHDG